MANVKRSARIKDLYSYLKKSPENQFFLSLIELLGNLEAENLETLVKTKDKDEMLRIQGGCGVLRNVYDNLTRRPVTQEDFKSGGFNQ